MSTQTENKSLKNDKSSKNETSDHHDESEIVSPAKKQKVENENSTGKKSVGKKKRSDTDMIAEAKALYGDLDTSAGRSMRRRSDPKPVEEKKKATPKRTSKKKEKNAKVEDKSPEKELKKDESKNEAKTEKAEGKEESKEKAEADTDAPSHLNATEEEKGSEKSQVTEVEKKEETPADDKKTEK